MQTVMYWTLDAPAENEANVAFYESPGNLGNCYGRPVRVSHVHTGTGSHGCPLVNLINGETSVPHRSYVLGATHRFYTIGMDPGLEAMGMPNKMRGAK